MEKKNLLKVLFLLFVMGFVSCDKEDADDNNNDNNSNNISSKTGDKSLFENMFKGTSWKMISYKYYKEDGTVENRDTNPGILTLASDHNFYIIGLIYDIYKTHDVIKGTWEATDKGISLWPFDSGNESHLYMMGFLALYGYHPIHTIIDYTDSWFKCGNNVHVYEFSKISYQGPSNGGGSGNGGNGDVPYVTSYNFTATKTSITVKFMCSERPSSATVKYGTSSPSQTVSSSISGNQVSATATGLRAGTKYYFNCTVRNSNGSSTSDTFTAITNY